jgi:hypothetical protein
VAKFFLRSVAEAQESPPAGELFPLEFLRACAVRDRHRVHQLVTDPAEADVVLFVESHRGIASGDYFERVRADPVYRRHRRRCLIHSGVDLPIALVPGIFPSIERRWYSRARTRPGPYLAERNPFLVWKGWDDIDGTSWLGSFVGCAAGKPARERMMGLRDPRILVQDTTVEFVGTIRAHDQARHERLKREYIEVARRSKFLLCPRGTGSSSIRLFEAMELGRAPVIVGDAWIEPPGPAWERFSIRVAERDLASIPAVLREAEKDAERMGAAAREEWERWYSEDHLFHTICETCADLLTARVLPEAIGRLPAFLEFLRPVHLRPLVRSVRARLRAVSSQRSAPSPAPPES